MEKHVLKHQIGCTDGSLAPAQLPIEKSFAGSPAMVRPRGLRLAALCPCLLVAAAWIPISFVGPVVTSRSPSTLRHFKNAPEAEPEPKDALEDVWRYIGGWYEIKKIDGKLYFRENNLQGELVAQDDWLVAELPPSGTIRLKLGPSGQEVLSNFKPADTDAGHGKGSG